MEEKLNITITIANQPPIPLTVKPQEVEIIRQAEATVNRLWETWREKFNVTPIEIMAMVAFQFAKLYTTQNLLLKNTTADLEELDKKITGLLEQGQ